MSWILGYIHPFGYIDWKQTIVPYLGKALIWQSGALLKDPITEAWGCIAPPHFCALRALIRSC